MNYWMKQLFKQVLLKATENQFYEQTLRISKRAVAVYTTRPMLNEQQGAGHVYWLHASYFSLHIQHYYYLYFFLNWCIFNVVFILLCALLTVNRQASTIQLFSFPLWAFITIYLLLQIE